MNWMGEVNAEIRNSGAPLPQIEALTLQVVGLSSICDKHLPTAPALQYEPVTEEDGVELTVSWFWREKSRVFSLHAEPDGKIVMYLLDDARAIDISSPTHEQVKTAALAFFEGWVPRD